MSSSPDPTDRTAPEHPRVYGRPGVRERRVLASALRTETVGGMVLLAAAVVALLWANTPLSGLYDTVRDFHFGIPALGLDLSVQHWASDGLLTIFFFVAGIELKRELVAGELRRPAAAALPVVAAVCGMVVPALFYVAVNGVGGGDMSGWAIPMATDIAFALGVLAVVGTNLPSGIRAFLLTLAIVDDLGAIVVIAVFYTSALNLWALAGAFAGLAVFWFLHHRLRVRGWYVYVPLGLVIWALMYNSGVHATIAGVAMGMLLRVLTREGEEEAPAQRVEHLIRPLSAGVAVPLFALFAAGVSVSGSALAEAARQPEAIGVVLGLFAGKVLGVFGGTYLAAKFTRARLSSDLAWSDVAGVSMLAGIGFTVSLLVTELAFTDGETTEHVKAAVLIASLLSAVAAVLVLRVRERKYRALWEEENRDDDHDGIPDLDQREEAALAAEEAAARAAAARREAADGGTGKAGPGEAGGSGEPARGRG